MDKEIAQQFDELGIEPSADVIAKSMELCISYHIEDATEFVEQWIAFSISNLGGEEPTIDYLCDFERKVFQAKREKEFAAASKKKTKLPVSLANLSHLNRACAESNPLAIYGVEGNDDEYIADFDCGTSTGARDDDVLDTYNLCKTPKAKGVLARTPARHSQVIFSPVSYSPISGTPRTNIGAPGSGKIVYTFGNPAIISTSQWSSLNQVKVHVRQLLLHNGEALSAAKSKYMFDNLREKTEIIGDRLFQIGKGLCINHFGSDAADYELTQVDMHSQDNIKTIGTICCDHEGPLDASSTLLVGSDEMRCRTVQLNFSKAKSVGVFPGQVVMVTGMNPRGDVIMVQEVIAERHLEAPTAPQFSEQLSFVIAAGPYTHDDDLVYDPLHDLVSYCKENKPDVLIMTGPFLEADHKLITENMTLAETFESFLDKMIAGIVDAIGTTTTLLLVSSHRDANADPVYPTIPLGLRKTYPNVYTLADPSIVDLNGIKVGMTSTDIVEHLLNHELAVNAGDKVKRVVNYLFNQGSFYPLHPPAEDKMCFDSYLANKYANIEHIPNILILPSDQKCFIRVVNGCLAINPGRLAAETGGTFARFIITPPASKDETNLFNYVGCQVRKV